MGIEDYSNTLDNESNQVQWAWNYIRIYFIPEADSYRFPSLLKDICDEVTQEKNQNY